MDNTNKDKVAFQKNRDSLWTSLQSHLDKLYEADKLFLKSLPMTDTYPFNPDLVEADKLAEYWRYRNSLKELFIDETDQLDTLVKAIKQKNYKEEDKKQLFLLILGYMDIAGSIFEELEFYKPASKNKDEELVNTFIRFDRIKKFARLNIRGILPNFNF